jgi:hypothetical protein
MRITGHRTRSVYDLQRLSDDDMRVATLAVFRRLPPPAKQCDGSREIRALRLSDVTRPPARPHGRRLSRRARPEAGPVGHPTFVR